MVALLAGNPPGMPYAGSPTVHAFMAASIEYFSVPGATWVGSFGDGKIGSWRFVVDSNAPCMSYVMTLP